MPWTPDKADAPAAATARPDVLLGRRSIFSSVFISMFEKFGLRPRIEKPLRTHGSVTARRLRLRSSMRLASPFRRRASASTSAPAGCVRSRFDGVDYYGGVVVGAATIGERALSPEVRARARELVAMLEPDDYVDYVCDFIRVGEHAGGSAWRYADILTALVAAAELLRPQSYLEIGVRRGRSLAMVAAVAPSCALLGIDLWVDNYAGIENPGPDHVRGEIAKVGFTGELELLSGDSHQLLPRLFDERPTLSFDLITIDGDHSPRGAARDLRSVLPRLRVGGALVFDDVRHPTHPELHRVWRRVVARDRRYATWVYDDLGYGVAVAVRRW